MVNRRHITAAKRCSGTSQSIDCPLFELLKGDLCSGGYFIEVQSVGVFLLLVCWGRELLLLMIKCTPPLGIYTVVVLPYHFGL